MGNFKDFEPLKANGRASRDWFWKQKWDQKWNPSVLRHFEQKCKWHHMTKSTFTCFLGHGPPIFQTNTCRFAIWTIPWHYKHWIRQFQEYLPWLHQVLPLVCWNAVPKWCMHKLTDCNFGLKLFLNESSMELESIRGLENFVPKIPASGDQSASAVGTWIVFNIYTSHFEWLIAGLLERRRPFWNGGESF